MLKDILNKLSLRLMRGQVDTDTDNPDKSKTNEDIRTSLQENINRLKTIMGSSNDIIFREFSFGQGHALNAGLVYVDGLTNAQTINESIIEPLMYKSQLVPLKKGEKEIGIEQVKEQLLSVGEVREVKKLDDAIDAYLSGDTVLMIDNASVALAISTRGWEKRGITEPGTETVVKGPREGFTESIRVNTSLLRRKIKNPDLTFESFTVGRKTRTVIMIAYLKSVADEALVQTVRDRLNKIETDGIMAAGYIEQYIGDAPYSMFPTVNYSEKPDVIAGRMLEGRVAVIIDGTPFVLSVPMFFFESFQTAEDYYIGYFFATVLRILRYFSFFVSVMGPAIYVALTTFHQELIPTKLLLSMASAREGIPFPSAIEAIILLMAFEIIREAGIRLPRPVGQAISIVGALVMGQSAVSAGLVGAPIVIVVAITAVANFVVPAMADVATIVRFILLLCAAWMGGYGIIIGLLILLIQMSAMKSFGVPYMSPYAPLQPKDLKDSFVRAPLWLMISRPTGLAGKDRKRRSITPPTKTDSGKA